MKMELNESAKRTVKLVAGAVVGLAIAGLGGLAFQNNQINNELLETIQLKEQEISRLQQAAQKAGSDVLAIQKTVKELTEQVQLQDSENAEQMNKIAAFEAQTAACEVLKSKAHGKK